MCSKILETMLSPSLISWLHVVVATNFCNSLIFATHIEYYYYSKLGVIGCYLSKIVTIDKMLYKLYDAVTYFILA